MTFETSAMIDSGVRPDLGSAAPKRCRTSERYEFFRAWLANPLRVASIVPSSRQLAWAITQEISVATGPVLELGPGTGVFTRALIARKVAEQDLVLVESGEEFIPELIAQFPRATVLSMDAARVRMMDLFGPSKAGAVISGLPLLSMSPRKVAAILHGAFRQLNPKGALYQFTYGPRCPVPRRLLDRLGLRAVRISTSFGNVPPASVYRITKRKILR